MIKDRQKKKKKKKEKEFKNKPQYINLERKSRKKDRESLTTITAPPMAQTIPKKSCILNFSFNANGAIMQFETKATVPSGATTEAGAKA